MNAGLGNTVLWKRTRPQGIPKGTQREGLSRRLVWVRGLLLLAACTALGSVRVAHADAPVAELHGPRTRPPTAPFPTSLILEEPYARTWDGAVAVLASRGFPLRVVARDSGVIATGWRVTQPNHQVKIGKDTFLGRKVERLTVLVRPIQGGAQVSISAQAALVSPQWSAAGVPPVGQAVDIASDTVTEYGLLFDLAQILGLSLNRVPDPSYGLALARTGVFVGGVGGPSSSGAQRGRGRDLPQRQKAAAHGPDVNGAEALPALPPPPPPPQSPQSPRHSSGGSRR